MSGLCQDGIILICFIQVGNRVSSSHRVHDIPLRQPHLLNDFSSDLHFDEPAEKLFELAALHAKYEIFLKRTQRQDKSKRI